MTDKEKLINSQPLTAYELMDTDTHNKMLPGYTKVPEERDNYRRFNRKGAGGAAAQ